MSNNAEKTDSLMKKLNGLDGVYCQPLSQFASHIEHNDKQEAFDITLSIGSEQIGGDRDVRSVLNCDDRLKMVPILVFVDPSELKEGEVTQG